MSIVTRLQAAWRGLSRGERQLAGHGRYPYGQFGLMHGGIVNAQSGMGLAGDKSEASFFTPTRVHWRGELETLRVQSWAARNYIGIPVDDMLIRWREFDSGGSDTAVDRFAEAERRHGVRARLARTMKAGRLYGSGLLVMVTREAPLEEPLMPERVRPGDLLALPVFDRYDASVWTRDDDVYSPTYGQALMYRINPTRGVGFYAHASRVLRFDGIAPLSDDGFTIYDRDWAVSEIVPAILAIMQDQTVATGVAHLSQEASIPIVKVEGLRDALTGKPDPNEQTAEEIGEQLNMLKSIYRLLMMDKTEEFERAAVSFAGLHEVMDRFWKRLAAAARIPATRFLGMSPVGMNATGESDMVNYAMHVAAMQNAMLTDPLMRLDMVVARDAGLNEPPSYSWVPLTSMSETEIAETAKNKAEAARTAIESGMIDEDEGRLSLDGDAFFGTLGGEAPGLPEPELPPEPPAPSND